MAADDTQTEIRKKTTINGNLWKVVAGGGVMGAIGLSVITKFTEVSPSEVQEDVGKVQATVEKTQNGMERLEIHTAAAAKSLEKIEGYGQGQKMMQAAQLRVLEDIKDELKSK
jgi:hypothetical protein